MNEATVGALGGAAVGSTVTLLGVWFSNRWRGREETYRMVRWAAEQASERLAVGIMTLWALAETDLPRRSDKRFVNMLVQVLLYERLPGGYPEPPQGERDAK